MPTFVIKFFLSMLLTTWVYNEFSYFLPEMKPYADKVISYINIPSHSVLLDSEKFKTLELKAASNIYGEIQEQIKKTSIGNSFKDAKWLNSEWFNSKNANIVIKQVKSDFDIFRNTSYLKVVRF